MGNHITDEQLARIVALSQAKAASRVAIMFDADEKGDDGAKDALWELAQTGLDAKLVWSQVMFGGRFADREPESLQSEDWNELTNRKS